MSYNTRNEAFSAAMAAIDLVQGGTVNLFRNSDGEYTVRIDAPPITLRSPRPGRWVASFTFREEGGSSHVLQEDVMLGTAQQALDALGKTLSDKVSQLNAGLKNN